MTKDAAVKRTFCIVPNSFYIASASWIDVHDEYHFFDTSEEIEYIPLCDDFGPMNISCVVRFIQILEEEIATYPGKKYVYVVEPKRRALTNGAFLLGSFFILKLGFDPENVIKLFKCMASTLVTYRDATFGPSDFGLSIQDCWIAIRKAIDLGWLAYPKVPGMWGKIRIKEYEHYENPLNADLVQVVPGKFIAFKGPLDLGAGVEFSDSRGFRKFSAGYYVKIFKHLRISHVVQLNERHYDPEVFESQGIRHLNMEFEDCTAPSEELVWAFLREADAASGLVAVHCKAGLGRTGTLIAAHMMYHHGFSAAAAIGWLRIMRPGSVIGPQQAFLVSLQEALAAAATPPAPITTVAGGGGGACAQPIVAARATGGEAAGGHGGFSARELAEQVSAASDRRAAAAAQAHTRAPATVTPSHTRASGGVSDALDLSSVSGAGRTAQKPPARLAPLVRADAKGQGSGVDGCTIGTVRGQQRRLEDTGWGSSSSAASAASSLSHWSAGSSVAEAAAPTAEAAAACQPVAAAGAAARLLRSLRGVIRRSVD